MLSCTCYFDDDAEWYFIPPNDFSKLKGKRRKRCCSCKELINFETPCLEFIKFRYSQNDIEDRIYGEGNEIYMAPWWMCEWCGEMYLNLDALGYCHYLGDSIKEAMEEYWELTGFKPKE